MHAISGWPLCSSVNTTFLPGSGTTTRVPHRMHPSYSDTSVHLPENSKVRGQPWLAIPAGGTGPLVLGGHPSVSALSGVSALACSTSSGNLPRASVFPCAAVFLNSNAYSYIDNSSDHRLILAEACDDGALS